MGSDIIITSIKNENAKKIIARLLCQKHSIMLQKAMEIVSKPPFLFLNNASDKEIKLAVERFNALGIDYKKVLSEKKEEPEKIPNINNQITKKSTVLPEQNAPDNIAHVNMPLHTEDKKSDELHIIHHLPIDDIPEIKTDNKKKFNLVSIVIISLIIIVPMILIVISLNKQHKSLLTGLNVEPVAEKNKNSVPIGQKNSTTSSIDKAISDDYTDSASQYIDNYEMAVKFYKLAISFNKYNYRAWYGLMNTYQNMNETKKANKVRIEMIKLFGDKIFDITTIVEPFGKIRVAELKEDSCYYLEYNTESNEKKLLIDESYQIIRALKPTCNCNSIALFASQSPGKGLMVHIKKDAIFFSLSEFENVASFTYLK